MGIHDYSGRWRGGVFHRHAVIRRKSVVCGKLAEYSAGRIYAAQSDCRRLFQKYRRAVSDRDYHQRCVCSSIFDYSRTELCDSEKEGQKRIAGVQEKTEGLSECGLSVSTSNPCTLTKKKTADFIGGLFDLSLSMQVHGGQIP